MKLPVLFLAAAALLPPRAAACEDWIIPRTTYYITAAQQAFPDFPPPPAPGSAADRADLKTVLEWQYKRAPRDCERGKSAAHADFDNFFGEISPFPLPLPEAAALIFRRVKTETDGAAADVKDRFKRKRPFLRDPVLEPCLGRIGGLAYPSGHATISRLLALMLGDLVPAGKARYLRRADEAALERVIGGVHHPSDIEAGKKLADRLYAAYKTSRPFAADMKTLRGLLDKEKVKAVTAEAAKERQKDKAKARDVAHGR